MSNTPASPVPEVSSASSWKQSSGIGAPLRVPSGNVCLVRPMNMQALIRNNLIPNELMDIVTGAMKSKKAPTMDELKDDDINADRMVAIMDCMDDVVMHMVVQPQIHPAPMNDEDYDLDKLYIHEVDQDDKTFIFQYAVGGTRDLEKFREGLASYVGTVAEKSDVDNSSE